MRKTFLLACLLGCWSFIHAQDIPNFSSGGFSPNSQKANDGMNVPVNYFTGMPSISVPLYSYKGATNGLGLDVSLSYSPGGIRVNETPSSVGLGWVLDAGGTITRTLRGRPDDTPNYGFVYASSIPTDFRSTATQYYYDSLDSQADIFNFSCPGGSGKFYLGKNGKVAVVPTSKIRIIPTYAGSNQPLQSFRIITEDGIKYDFEFPEFTNISLDETWYHSMPSSVYNRYYTSAWHLSRIISAFNTDTIKFHYTERDGHAGFRTPQASFVPTSGYRIAPTPGQGTQYYGEQELTSIDFPNGSHLDFGYSFVYKRTDDLYAISKVRVSDTVFRYGYLLDYDTMTLRPRPGHTGAFDTLHTKLFLNSVTPYTAKEKQDGYRFAYNGPYFPKPGSYGDTLGNKIDYWGFYNGLYNGYANDPITHTENLIPNINGFSWGADRRPRDYYTEAGSLNSFILPGGGYTNYTYELNDHYPITKQAHQFQVAPSGTATADSLPLNQVFSSKQRLSFVVDRAVQRTGTPPVSGAGTLNCTIKNMAGTVTYATTAISLYDLFYQGIKTWSFNMPNGLYRLETVLASGTSISGSLPINVAWENKLVNTAVGADSSGGLRVQSIFQNNPDSVTHGVPAGSTYFQYLTEDGKSSGFLGDFPKYDYPYVDFVDNGGVTTTNYTAYTSEPVGDMQNVQGSHVGYSRVTVYKGALDEHLGRTVYDFTDFNDVNADGSTVAFPFVPKDIRSWGIGLAKRISLYDSSGNLVKRTINQYGFDTVAYTSNDFKGIKLGHASTYYITSKSDPSPTKAFIGEPYYPAGGRAYLLSRTDSLFHINASVTTGTETYAYDTCFNLTKKTASYDRTRGLQLEERYYYPYNYTVGGAIGQLRDSGIISPVIATENWIVGDANPRIVSGSITGFQVLATGAIKPDTSFALETNRPIVQATIGSFDPSVLNRNRTYFRAQGHVDDYDDRNNPKQMTNLVTGRSSSVISDYDLQYPIAKVSNATYNDIAHTSFESDGSGNWTIGSTARNGTYSLTGKWSYELSNGDVSRAHLSSSVNYLLTVWAKSGASFTVNGSSPGTAIATQNGWNLYQVAFTGTTTVTVSGTGLVDELRLHPKDANMVTYTYEPMIGITSTTDANNTVLYNEYDNLNRLKLIRNKDKNIVKRFQYSDTVMAIDTRPIWVGIGRQCHGGDVPYFDSVYRDNNLFSDSSGYIKSIEQSALECSCTTSPQYAIIYGSCEQGTWCLASVEYKKVLVDGYLQWRYVLTYRYGFTDGSQSSYYQEMYSTVSYPLTCSIPY